MSTRARITRRWITSAVLAALVAGAPTRRRREMSQDRRAQLEATRLRWAREDAHGVR